MPQQLPGQYRLQKSSLIIDAISRNIGRLIVCGSAVFIAYLWIPVFIAFAGKTTDANFRFWGNFTIGQVGAGVTCAATTTWGFVERRLRKRAGTKAQERISYLESELSRRRGRKAGIGTEE